jgi:uncharacterized protein YecE (DUF72 family)
MVEIGTSGWVYDHWRGLFYPPNLPQKKWFAYYADHFQTVEINNTFYQLPAEDTFRSWRDQAPDGFPYAVKANRYITHMKKLHEAEEAVNNFLSRARLLGDHLGPILWQLPPNWYADPGRLANFAKLFPGDLDHAFEFRETDWFQEQIKVILEENGLSFVIFSLPGLDCPHWITADPVYLCFHGAHGKYQGRYGREGLEPWGDRIGRWAEEGYAVNAYFNNDVSGYAVRDAQSLLELVDGEGS